MSSFSSVDAATTIFFTDDPLAGGATPVRVVHFSELRDAVNAFRRTAGLAPLPPDATVSAGAVVQARHVEELRSGLGEARATAGLSPLDLTDPTLTAGVTRITTQHVQELRSGVK